MLRNPVFLFLPGGKMLVLRGFRLTGCLVIPDAPAGAVFVAVNAVDDHFYRVACDLPGGIIGSHPEFGLDDTPATCTVGGLLRSKGAEPLAGAFDLNHQRQADAAAILGFHFPIQHF